MRLPARAKLLLDQAQEPNRRSGCDFMADALIWKDGGPSSSTPGRARSLKAS